MGVIIRPAQPVAGTGDFISPEQVAMDGGKTIDMLLNAGVLHDEIARRAWAAG